MKPGTIETAVKGTATVGAAVSLQLANSLSQWAESGESPSRLMWVVIICITIAAGWNAIISFMSGSYERWKNGFKDKI